MENQLEEMKKRMIHKIEVYDSSEAVNQFFIDNAALWLDKATRVSVNYTIEISQAQGKDTMDLWYGTMKYTLPIVLAKQMLSQLEIYAYQCFNVTAQHKANVMAMDDIGKISEYDYTTGYPEKLSFVTQSEDSEETTE